MKTYFKLIIRMFKKYFTRMLSILAILLISVSFVSGVGSSTIKVNDSVYEYYQNNNVPDLIIKSTNMYGFTEEDINKISDIYGSNNIMLGTSFDIENDNKITRYYYLDLNDININKLELLEGNLPVNDNEVLVERKTSGLKSYKVGEEFTYNNLTYKVSGIVKNSMFFQVLEEPSYIENKDLDYIIYLNKNSYLPINDIYVSFENKNLLDNMSDDYKELIKSEKNKIENILENITILSLYENISFFKLFTLTDKIKNICLILLVGFILVSGLVVLSTMTRLIEDERKQIACLKTLGYSNYLITFKYLLFAFFSTIIGSLLAYYIGIFITNLIYTVFSSYFDMPVMTNKISNFYYILSLLILVLSALIVTFSTSYKIASEKPAELLKKKGPKKGKKILLERISFIWNNLSFKYKSTFRNLFRYKKHFLMTVISILGSTILVFLATGLLSYSLHDELLGEALTFICFIILICAGLLTILVICTLTSINISERYKEISTLMVLGYYDNEVCGYVYREIYIMSIIGTLLGVPLGHFCLQMVFKSLDFGSMNDVGWYVYILTPLFTIIFTVLVTLVLKKKITGVDINDSLKEND